MRTVKKEPSLPLFRQYLHELEEKYCKDINEKDAKLRKVRGHCKEHRDKNTNGKSCTDVINYALVFYSYSHNAGHVPHCAQMESKSVVPW